MNLPNLESNASQYFKWKELLWLPRWNRYATEDELTTQILHNLVTVATRTDRVRDLLNAALITSSGFRPPKYSALVGGSETDVHTQGLAIDFVPMMMTAQAARDLIVPNLELFNIRLENNSPNGDWVHVDAKDPLPGHMRYFFP